MKVKVENVEIFWQMVDTRMPFRYGSAKLVRCPHLYVVATVRDAQGAAVHGIASDNLPPKWFDKDLALSNADNFAQLRSVLRMAREGYLSDGSAASAFCHFACHHDAHLAAAAARGFNPLLASYGPALLDRALLDALCRAQDLSFYQAMQVNLAGIGAAHPSFDAIDFGRFLGGLAPASTIEARHTVGLLDAITGADLEQRIDDGLPETLEEVQQRYRHRYFKLKVAGNIAADLDRLGAIAALLDRGDQPYFVSLDGNEQYLEAAGVAELLAGIRAAPHLQRLYRSILFIEQPIARKLALEVDLRSVGLDRPVIIDESDGELDSFDRARSQGYAGASSKTCKGLYKSILNAARCAQWNAGAAAGRYFMSAEDLTTQAGVSVQQDLALVNLLGITHVERNGHHYVNGMAALPEAEQQDFLRAHPDIYAHTHGATRLKIEDGRIALGTLHCRGYASAALPDFTAMQPLQ